MKEIKFAENLKHLRKSIKMSQKELGKLLNVERRAVGTLVRDETEPNLRTLAKLCEIFNETFDTLLS